MCTVHPAALSPRYARHLQMPDTVIFGAAFDGFKVIHTGVEGVENIAPLRKSKYVAASAGDCFRQTKALLEQGRQGSLVLYPMPYKRAAQLPRT